MMIKTILYRLEGVILNEELLRFKFYEILWYYLRREKEWSDFGQLMKIRDFLASNNQGGSLFLTIAEHYLSPREYEKYKQQIDYFGRKHSSLYSRLVPGIRTVIQTTNYYYQNAIFAGDERRLLFALRQYRLSNLFYYATSESDNQKVAGRQFFQKILAKTRSEPSETVLISNRLESDIVAAKALGMPTIQARFETGTRGFFPQNQQEKLYFQSLEKIGDWPKIAAKRGQLPMAIAGSPDEIVRIIQEMEAGEPVTEPSGELSAAPTFSDLMRQLLAPPSGNE